MGLEHLATFLEDNGLFVRRDEIKRRAENFVTFVHLRTPSSALMSEVTGWTDGIGLPWPLAAATRDPSTHTVSGLVFGFGPDQQNLAVEFKLRFGGR